MTVVVYARRVTRPVIKRVVCALCRSTVVKDEAHKIRPGRFVCDACVKKAWT
jgi:formylmethanofuran dehydrogenase subunit E